MIGIICNNLDAGGGLEVVTLRLFEAFKKHNTDVQLYSCKETKNQDAFSFNLNSTRLVYSQIKRMIEHFVEYRVDNLIVQLSGPYDILANKKIYEMCRKHGISVFVVIHNSPKSFISRYRNVLDNFFIHILKIFRTVFILKFKYRRLFRAIAKNATFITLSEGNKKELEKFYKIRSFVIPNYYEGIIQKNSRFEKQHSLAYIGRIDFLQKNLKYLLDAWNLVIDKKDWMLNIIGGGNDKELKYLNDYIKKNNIKNTIVIGKLSQDRVACFLNENSILLLTSYFEGFPTVVLEAASFKNALVVNRYDGFSDEIIKNYENSFVVDGKKDDFAEKIQILINEPDLRKKFQEQIYAQYNDYIKSNNVINEWKTFFNSKGKR